MVDFDSLKASAADMFTSAGESAGANYMLYVGWLFWAGLMIGTIVLIYYYTQFKYKVTILEGSIAPIKDDKGNNKVEVKVLKVRKDRAMPIKDKGVSKWRLLFTWNKKIEPVDFRYIMPGNNVFLFRTGTDSFNPMQVPSVSNPTANYVIDPFDASFFNMGIQQDAKDYQHDDAARKQMAMTIATVVLCLAAVVFATWIIFKFGVAKTADQISFAAKSWEAVKAGVAPK